MPGTVLGSRFKADTGANACSRHPGRCMDVLCVVPLRLQVPFRLQLALSAAVSADLPRQDGVRCAPGRTHDLG
jgi:hypothetical protein